MSQKYHVHYAKIAAQAFQLLTVVVLGFFLSCTAELSRAAELQDIRYGIHDNFTRVVFEFQQPVQYESPLISGNKLSVVFYDTTSTVQSFLIPDEETSLDSIVVTERESGLIVEVNLLNTNVELKDFLLSEPTRIVFDLYWTKTFSSKDLAKGPTEYIPLTKIADDTTPLSSEELSVQDIIEKINTLLGPDESSSENPENLIEETAQAERNFNQSEMEETGENLLQFQTDSDQHKSERFPGDLDRDAKPREFTNIAEKWSSDKLMSDGSRLRDHRKSGQFYFYVFILLGISLFLLTVVLRSIFSPRNGRRSPHMKQRIFLIKRLISNLSSSDAENDAALETSVKREMKKRWF